jgi:hypothetical protein
MQAAEACIVYKLEVSGVPDMAAFQEVLALLQSALYTTLQQLALQPATFMARGMPTWRVEALHPQLPLPATQHIYCAFSLAHSNGIPQDAALVGDHAVMRAFMYFEQHLSTDEPRFMADRTVRIVQQTELQRLVQESTGRSSIVVTVAALEDLAFVESVEAAALASNSNANIVPPSP